MINQKETSILMFFPRFLKTVKEIINLSKTVDKKINQLLDKFSNLNRMKKIVDGDLAEDELELLLWEKHVDYFDKTLSREQKIKLVKSSLETHMKKGTRGALDKQLNVILGELTVLEWFEYDGEPDHFKVVIMDKQPSDEVVARLNRTISEYKNEGTIFEGIMIVQTQEVLEYDFTGHTEIYYEEQLVN